jgi:hypothetical protein
MPEKTSWKYALFRTPHGQQSPKARRVRASGREKPFERKWQIEGDSDMENLAQSFYIYNWTAFDEAGNMPESLAAPKAMQYKLLQRLTAGLLCIIFLTNT